MLNKITTYLPSWQDYQLPLANLPTWNFRFCQLANLKLRLKQDKTFQPNQVGKLIHFKNQVGKPFFLGFLRPTDRNSSWHSNHLSPLGEREPLKRFLSNPKGRVVA